MFLTTINNYFTLIRVPNLFTVISNILVGYFLVVATYDTDIYQLFYLILVSIFLYIGGVVMNDLFDIKLDKSERPERPLPSNQIKKKNAIIICIVSISMSLFISFFLLHYYTFIITLSMILLIIIYNSKTKKNKWRSVTLGSIRCL
ncbi:MAG: UbiA family prenyltransferase, partial [Nitrososphaeraceae archaeon]